MKKEAFKIIKERLELSESFREQYKEKWEKYRKVYENHHYDGSMSKSDRITVPYITGLIRTIIPSVFTRQPKFWVFARKEEYKQNVDTIEKGIDFWWHKLKLQKVEKRMLLANLVTGYSCLFYAYLYTREKKKKRVENEEGKDTSAALTKSPHRSFRLTKQGDKNETFVSEEVTANRPYFERLDPINDILIDPMTTQLVPYNGRYAIRIIRKTEEEVKAKFPKAKNQEPDSTITKEYIEEGGSSKKMDNKSLSGKNVSESDDSKIFTLYEYWTKDERILFIKDMDEPLEESENPYWNKIPFIFSENYERESSPYPISEVEMADPMTQELDKTRSQIINHRKRFNRKYAYDKNHVDEETMAALEHPEDGTLIPIDGTPTQVVQPLADAPLPAGVYENESSIKNDFQYIMANFDYTRGGRQTATEVREIADTTFSRQKEKMLAVEELSIEIAEVLLKLLQFGWDENDVLPYVDEISGTQKWVNVDPDSYEGEYIFRFQQGSTEPLNEELMMKRALDVFNLFALDQSGDIDQYELKKWVLQTLKVQNIAKILPEKPIQIQAPLSQGLGEVPGQAQGPGALSPTSTQLPNVPQPPSPALSNAAMQENPTNVANLLRGQGL